jgi:hypothetical protein
MPEKKIEVEDKSKNIKRTMIITKDDAGEITSAKVDGREIKDDVLYSGEIKDLKLGFARGHDPEEEQFWFRQNLLEIPDETVIETHSSPGCKWYFYHGRWYRVCT